MLLLLLMLCCCYCCCCVVVIVFVVLSCCDSSLVGHRLFVYVWFNLHCPWDGGWGGVWWCKFKVMTNLNAVMYEAVELSLCQG